MLSSYWKVRTTVSSHDEVENGGSHEIFQARRPKYLLMNELLLAPIDGTTDCSAFLKIEDLIHAAQMDAKPQGLSGKRPWRSSIQDQPPSVRILPKITEKLLALNAANKLKKHKVSEREYMHQSKVVLQNFVSILHILDHALE